MMNVIPTCNPFRGAMMRATWTKARLWGLVPSAGGDIMGTATSRVYENVTGKSLVLNAATVRGGVLQAGLRHAGNNTFIPGYGLTDCIAFQGDEAAVSIGWSSGRVIPPHVGAVTVTFTLLRARLYSLAWE